MSDDLIKRSDAAEVVYKALKTPPLKGVLADTMSLAIALVRDIPSADRPQEWIPCSERLPREYRTVLVTWKYKGKSYTTTAFRETKNAVTYWASDEQPNYTPLNVVAWMPLPEPWKGADDEVL